MSTQYLSALEKNIVAKLSYKAGLAALLFDSWSEISDLSIQSEKTLINMAQLGVTEEASAREILNKSVDLGIIKKVSSGYIPIGDTYQQFKRFAFALYTVDYYATSVHKDVTIAGVVLTKPPKPSTLEKKLSDFGWKTSDIEPTEHAFKKIAQSAKQRLIVMTPFFDVKGAAWLQELFSLASPNVERILILRSLEAPSRNDYPLGFDSISTWLTDNSIKVFNYSIPKLEGKGRETFHAKVVLSDHNAAYVGSSNINTASLEHSMEMGVTLFGRAAADVSVVLDAVLNAAVEWSNEDIKGKSGLTP